MKNLFHIVAGWRSALVSMVAIALFIGAGHAGNHQGIKGWFRQAEAAVYFCDTVFRPELYPATNAINRATINAFQNNVSSSAIKYIRIVLPETSRINIELYDVNGNFIKSFVKGEYQKGCYEFEWNGNFNHTEIVPGIYFLIFKVNNLEHTRMIIGL